MVLQTIIKLKPSVGTYSKCFLSSTMGVGIEVDSKLLVKFLDNNMTTKEEKISL